MAVIRSSLRRWEYAAARDPCFSALVAVHITIIITIAALTYISDHHQGIATLPDSSLTDSGEIWSLPLLWTSVPTLVMTLLALAVSSTVYAVRDRQPFADMALNGGSTLDKTLLLDYRTTFGAFQWIRAARNGHWPLSLSLLSAIFLSVAVPPLSARLFTEQLINREVPTLFPITHRLNLSVLSYSSTPHMIDWKPLFELATSIALFNASPPACSDTSFAYEHFALPPLQAPSPTGSQPPNPSPATPALFRGPVNAYTADADCVPVPPGDFSARRTSQGFFSSAAPTAGVPSISSAPPSTSSRTIPPRSRFSWGRTARTGVGRRPGRVGCWLLVGGGGKGDTGGGGVNGVVGQLGVISCMTGYLQVRGTLTVRSRGVG